MKTSMKSFAGLLFACIICLCLYSCDRCKQGKATQNAKFLGTDFYPAPINCNCRITHSNGRVSCIRTACCDSLPKFKCYLFAAPKNDTSKWTYKRTPPPPEDNEDSVYKCVCAIPIDSIPSYTLDENNTEDDAKNYCIYRVQAVLKPASKNGLNVNENFCFGCKTTTPNCDSIIVVKDQNDGIYYCVKFISVCTVCNKRYMH